MKTDRSIDLSEATEKCFAHKKFGGDITCECLIEMEPGCNTAECPFYKPNGCKDWVRIEDEDGINLIPPEEYYYYGKKRYV